MKPPPGFRRTVRLYSQVWDIVYPESTPDDVLGSSEGSRRLITVTTGQSRESMIDTLLHECVHSYLRMTPGASDGWEYPDAERTEEAIVVAVTSAMIDLFRANPWVAQLVLSG